MDKNKEKYADLLKSFNKSKDILDKYLIMPGKNPSGHDAWCAYSKCSREDLEVLVKRGDKTALVFYHCKVKEK